MEKSLAAQEEAKGIDPICISAHEKVQLWSPPKILVIAAGIVLGRVVLQMTINKRLFSQTVEINCPKTVGIKLKDLDKKVSSNRFDHELIAADSIIPPEVINAPLVKLTKDQLLTQRLPKQCSKNKIWVPRDDEGKRWLCVDYKYNKLSSLDEIYEDPKKPGNDFQWKEIRGSIPKKE
jgi:hypothetical protein